MIFLKNNQHSILIITSIFLVIWIISVVYDSIDIPEVWMNGNECVKVINYKIGETFTCNDKDVKLQTYILVNVDNKNR